MSKSNKIDPGEGYVILKVGTVLKAGDEYKSRSLVHIWSVTCDEGRIIGDNDLTYRRKKPITSRNNNSHLIAENKRMQTENKKLQDTIANMLDILKVTYNKYDKDNRR